MTDEQMQQALIAICEKAEPVTLTLTPLQALMIVGQLQVALRHPYNHGLASEVGFQVCHGLIDQLAPTTGPARDLCELGFDPRADVPVAPKIPPH